MWALHSLDGAVNKWNMASAPLTAHSTRWAGFRKRSRPCRFMVNPNGGNRAGRIKDTSFDDAVQKKSPRPVVASMKH